MSEFSRRISILSAAAVLILSPPALGEEEASLTFERPEQIVRTIPALRLSPPEVERETRPDEPRILASGVGSDPVPVSGFAIDTSDRRSTLTAYHRYYAASEGLDEATGWTGLISQCHAGALSQTYHDAVLRRVNYYRAQVGLPSTIRFDAVKNAQCQEASLVMAVQNDLSHNPAAEFPENPCLTAGAQTAASRSNLALGSFGPTSIDRFIIDDGANNAAVGHRRWLFYLRAQEMGHGSIPFGAGHNAASAVWVVGDFLPEGEPVPVAWPNAGYCPFSLAPDEDQSYARWSFSYPGADFSASTVTMTLNGSPLSLDQETVTPGAGDNTIVWRPDNFPSDPPADGSDRVVDVAIDGIAGAPFSQYRYQVRLMDPFDLQEELVVSGPSRASLSPASTYTFNAIAGADGYAVRVSRKNAEPWMEGAESAPSLQIIDDTSAHYDVYSSALASEGDYSFHLMFPGGGQESFTLDRYIVPSETSVLVFERRFRFFFPTSALRAEISKDDGASWTVLHEVWGNNYTGSSAEWDSTWLRVEEAVPADFIGVPMRLRFRIQPSGSYYRWPGDPSVESHYGVFIDGIEVTDSTQLEGASVTRLDAQTTTFSLDESIGVTVKAGEEYVVEAAPIFGNHAFSYSDALVVTGEGAPSAAQWREAYFGTVNDEGLFADEADFDGDGLANLLERALGLDPTKSGEVPGDGAMPVGGIGQSGSLSNRLVLAFTLPQALPGDVIYEVEVREAGASWRTVARKVAGEAWDALGTDSVIVETPMSSGTRVEVGTAGLAGGSSHAQLRLTVSSR